MQDVAWAEVTDFTAQMRARVHSPRWSPSADCSRGKWTGWCGLLQTRATQSSSLGEYSFLPQWTSQPLLVTEDSVLHWRQPASALPWAMVLPTSHVNSEGPWGSAGTSALLQAPAETIPPPTSFFLDSFHFQFTWVNFSLILGARDESTAIGRVWWAGQRGFELIGPVTTLPHPPQGFPWPMWQGPQPCPILGALFIL